MTQYQTVVVEKHGAVTLIRLNRPEALNALNSQVLTDLIDAFATYEADGSQRCAVVTGNDKAFAAGADIKEMSSRGFSEMFGENYFGGFDRVTAKRKPWIAAVAGFTLGGGCELAMMADFIIAAETAKFGQPEVKLGIAPGYGGTQRLPRLVGKGNALRLILTGDMIDATEAYRIGLVNQVVPGGQLLATAEQTLRGILAMGPLAVRLALEAVDQGLEMTLDEGLLLEANHFGLLAATEDMKEGLTAFLEKRPPRFRGR